MKFLHSILIQPLALLFALASHSSALAAPTIFSEPKENLSWWLNLKLSPMKSSDEGISVDQVNDFIKSRLAERAVSSPLINFKPICFMDFVRDEDIVSSDRKLQIEIQEDLRAYPGSFYQVLSAGGETFFVRVGIFEGCPSDEDPKESPFMALVISDVKNRLVEFDALSWDFIRLFRSSSGKLLVSGCFNCGELQEINYNPAAKEFYYKWMGH